MYIQAGRTYRVESCLDIDFYVKKICYAGPNYIKLKVNYVYRNKALGIIVDNKQYKLTYEDSKRWHRI